MASLVASLYLRAPVRDSEQELLFSRILVRGCVVFVRL